MPPPGLPLAAAAALPSWGPPPHAAAAAVARHAAEDDGDEDEDDTQFLFGAVNTALAHGQDRRGGSADPFVESESVLSLLQTSGTKHATLGAAAHTKQHKKAAPSPKGAPAGVAPSTDLKTAAEIAVALSASVTGHATFDWNALVLRTQQTPRFQADYTFATDHTWVQTRPHAEWAAAAAANRRGTAPGVIAIDCEMCETMDPVTGQRDPASLVRISVVNGLAPDDTLLDTLVAPSLPVSDWRTQIHGIAEKDLAGVTFTLRQAQAFILNTCSDRTIIIGHAVHHDLKALRVQHANVVDTAYLYTVDKEPGHHASVRDISEQVLGVKLPQVHDSVQDARASLQVRSMTHCGQAKKRGRTLTSLFSTVRCVHMQAWQCSGHCAQGRRDHPFLAHPPDTRILHGGNAASDDHQQHAGCARRDHSHHPRGRGGVPSGCEQLRGRGPHRENNRHIFHAATRRPRF